MYSHTFSILCMRIFICDYTSSADIRMHIPSHIRYTRGSIFSGWLCSSMVSNDTWLRIYLESYMPFLLIYPDAHTHTLTYLYTYTRKKLICLHVLIDWYARILVHSNTYIPTNLYAYILIYLCTLCTCTAISPCTYIHIHLHYYLLIYLYSCMVIFAICLYAHTPLYLRAHRLTWPYPRMLMHLCTYIPIYSCTYVPLCLCAHIPIDPRVPALAHLYTYIYLHTYELTSLAPLRSAHLVLT
jgi:hypothetical protein